LRVADRVYRPDVDGLRAMAILPVVLYHAGVTWLPGGFSGVDLFFAISGYLIGGHIYRDLCRGTFRYASFYQRRAKRILPTLFVVLVAVLVVCGWLYSPYELRAVGSSAAATVASVSNILFVHGGGYFAARSENNPLLMTWSLGVEEQFYFLIPLLMVGLCKLRQRLVLPMILLVAMVSFGFAWVELGRHPTADFYLLPSRAWELALGVGLAIFEARAAVLPLDGRGWRVEGLAWTGLVLVVAPFCCARRLRFLGRRRCLRLLGACCCWQRGVAGSIAECW
jgi:peptidoglycan/LPS O-acetylase OafA/YrhL